MRAQYRLRQVEKRQAAAVAKRRQMYIYYDGDELARNAASGELTPVAELPHDAVRIVITYVDTWPP